MANNIKIGNAPCSWGALEFDLEGKVAGFQQVLDEIAGTGYTGTELGDWGFMPTDPEMLHNEIATRNLSLIGAFVPVALSRETAHEDGISRALKVAGLMHEAGYPQAFIVLADENGSIPQRTRHAGRIKENEGLNEAEMQTFGLGAEKIARAVKKQFGMRTVFHHHCAGYIETPEEINAFLAVTDPSLVGLCFDTGHYAFGGGKDIAGLLEKHGERIWHVHFKDYAPEIASRAAENNWDYFQSVKNGVFCELSKGNVDFETVIKFLKNKNYAGWIVVEQDVLPGMGSPKLCADYNRKYLLQKGL